MEAKDNAAYWEVPRKGTKTKDGITYKVYESSEVWSGQGGLIGKRKLV